MTERRPRYEVQLISGKVIKDLSYEEANKLFYSHAGSVDPMASRHKAP